MGDPQEAEYEPPIPSYIQGWNGRLSAHYKKFGGLAPTWLRGFVSQDFEWFARRFKANPAVSPEAKRVFDAIFVFGPIPPDVDPTSANFPGSSQRVAERGELVCRRGDCDEADERDDDTDEEDGRPATPGRSGPHRRGCC